MPRQDVDGASECNTMLLLAVPLDGMLLVSTQPQHKAGHLLLNVLR